MDEPRLTPTAEISLREVYDLVLEIKHRLGDIPEDMKDHETRLRALEARENTAEAVTDHETRLRAMEKKLWGFAGVAALLGTLGSKGLEALAKLGGG